MFHKAFDRTALARGIAPFEQDHDLLPGFLDPVLNLEKFDLQFRLVRFVGFARHHRFVGINTFAENFLDRLRIMLHFGELVVQNRGGMVRVVSYSLLRSLSLAFPAFRRCRLRGCGLRL